MLGTSAEVPAGDFWPRAIGGGRPDRSLPSLNQGKAILPDVLAPNLALVFCGTAAGPDERERIVIGRWFEAKRVGCSTMGQPARLGSLRTFS